MRLVESSWTHQSQPLRLPLLDSRWIMFECTLGVMKFVYDGIASLVYCSVFAVKECPFPSHHVVRALIVDRVRCLNSSSILEQRRQIALLSLQVRVSANVLLRNEDVGHGGLASHLAERALDRGTVVCDCHSLVLISSALPLQTPSLVPIHSLSSLQCTLHPFAHS